jgi:hypothetical protein
MKIILYRSILVLIALGLGTGIFVLLTFAGDKTKGPLENIFSSVNTNIASFEKSMTGTREKRSQSLLWFDNYRKNKIFFNSPDTFFVGAYDDQMVESYESVVALEDSLKIKFPIISFYTAWGSKRQQVFPMLRAQAIYDLGSVPMITWEPWLDDFDAAHVGDFINKENKNKGGMRAVAQGKFDVYIDKWATDAAKFQHPFFMRFGHEMNDPYRYPWGPQNNDPQDYIDAWKHVRSRFTNAGATNALWIWSPHPAYETYPQFYPGHDNVDWIGVTALNYGTVATWSQWWSLEDIIQKSYDSLSLYKKPMMLTEYGSLSVGGERAIWFKEGLTTLPQKYPAVKSVVFFHTNSDNTTTYKALDWSFKNDEGTKRAITESFRSWLK